jgi:hypothetical protein
MYNKGQTPNEKENLPFFSLFLFFFFFLLKIKFKTFFLSFVSFVSTERRIYNAAPLPSCSLTSAGFLSNKSPGHIEEEEENGRIFSSSYSKEREKTKKNNTHSTMYFSSSSLHIFKALLTQIFLSLSSFNLHKLCIPTPFFCGRMIIRLNL